MAFRTETKIGAVLILLFAGASSGQTGVYEVRHQHFHDGGNGALRIDVNSISFGERGKQAKHSRQWKFEDIQELVLAPDTLRIVTYEDQRWEPGRDRVYVFDRLPQALAKDWYPIFARSLDRRFVAALADPPAQSEWKIPAKLIHGRAGSQGVIVTAANRVVYQSAQAGESRTWRVSDLENVSSADPFDLTITTYEGTFRFQLKQALPEARFDELWRSVNHAKGLEIFTPNHSTGERQ